MIVENNCLHYRQPDYSDSKLVFNWTNLAEVRNNSFSKFPIKYKNHLKWFKEILKKKFYLVIFTLNDVPCGMVRLKESNNEKIINYMLDPNYREKKISSLMIKIFLSLIFKEYKYVKVYANVFNHNTPSVNCLKAAGFKLVEIDNIKSKFVINNHEI